MKCKNCKHKIELIKHQWIHKPYNPSCFGYGNCEWNCGCNKPEPTIKILECKDTQ